MSSSEQPKLRLTPGMILRRGHYLYFFSFWVYGQVLDRRRFGHSLDNTIFNASPSAYPVQSISYPYLRELVRCVDFDAGEVFVDVGCAWGRLLSYLYANTPLQRLVGVELNPEAARGAARAFCEEADIQIIQGDILSCLPANGTTFFLFNPFDATTMEAFLDKLEATVNGPVRLLYLYPTCADVLEARAGHWTLTRENVLKPKHLGPLPLLEYRYQPK